MQSRRSTVILVLQVKVQEFIQNVISHLSLVLLPGEIMAFICFLGLLVFSQAAIFAADAGTFYFRFVQVFCQTRPKFIRDP